MPGDGFERMIEGVSVTATRARRAEQAATRWPAVAPQTGLAQGPLGAAQAADRELARQFAFRARALAEFAASRPVAADRAQGEPGR